MAIYVFSILVGYVPNGVDYAQGRRYKYFKKLSQDVKYIFTDMPLDRYVQRYRDMGIETCDMMSAHLFLSGNGAIGEDAHITTKALYYG